MIIKKIIIAVIICLFASYTSAKLVIAQPDKFISDAYNDSLSKIPELKRKLVGVWNSENFSDPKERYILGYSNQVYRLTFSENGNYTLVINSFDDYVKVDSGTWDVWYLPKGYYGDTIFYADGFYIKFHSVFADSASWENGRFPEKILHLSGTCLKLRWECYCGVIAPDKTFTKEITDFLFLPHVKTYDSHYFKEDISQEILKKEQAIQKKEIDILRQNLIGIWRARYIPYYLEGIRISDMESVTLTNRKRSRWNQKHDRDYGYLTYIFNDDGTYLLEFIDPLNGYYCWSNKGHWAVFADSINPKKKYLKFYNSSLYDYYSDEPGSYQLSFLPDSSYELFIFNTYSDFSLRGHVNYLESTYFERMADDIIYVPQIVEILRKKESGILRRLVMSDIYYNEDQNTWHLMYHSLRPDCHPCEHAYIVIDASNGKIIERKVENRKW